MDGIDDFISMQNRSRLSYILFSIFYLLKDISEPVLSCLNGLDLEKRTCSHVKSIIEKVQKHACGHASLTDVNILLERIGMLNETVERYFQKSLESFDSCKATVPRHPSRKVSISSLSMNLNYIVFFDHWFLEKVRLFHAMDIKLDTLPLILLLIHPWILL